MLENYGGMNETSPIKQPLAAILHRLEQEVERQDGSPKKDRMVIFTFSPTQTCSMYLHAQVHVRRGSVDITKDKYHLIFDTFLCDTPITRYEYMYMERPHERNCPIKWWKGSSVF